MWIPVDTEQPLKSVLRFIAHSKPSGQRSATSDKGDTMWKEGSIRVNGEVFHYWMKQYDKGSEWGIDGGRISKLMLKRDGKIVCNYDRGWDIEPADENTQLALELLLHSENW